MNPFEEALTTNYILANERIAELEHTLIRLRNQLRDTHAEDGVLITIINEGLECTTHHQEQESNKKK